VELRCSGSWRRILSSSPVLFEVEDLTAFFPGLPWWRKGIGSAAFPLALHRPLPSRCYGAPLPGLLRADHTVSSVDDAMIFGRHGGPYSTSRMEALFCIHRWSSTLLHRQVVRPRRRRSGRRLRCIAGSMPPSTLASDLDGHVLRSPARGGGDTQGPDFFLSFGFMVYSASLEALSSNSRFLSARVVKGHLCNLYPPRVMNE
jgi:hypothetical protein